MHHSYRLDAGPGDRRCTARPALRPARSAGRRGRVRFTRVLSTDTVYILKLRRRGIDLDHRPPSDVLAGLTVVASDGTYLGVASARAAAETLADGAHDGTPVREVAHLPRAVRVDTGLADVLEALVGAQSAGLPVLDAECGRLAGWITHQAVLGAMHQATFPRAQ